jgi:hypothetical protein
MTQPTATAPSLKTHTAHGVSNPTLLERNVNVCRLDSGLVCISIRKGETCLAFDLTDEDRDHLIHLLNNPPCGYKGSL